MKPLLDSTISYIRQAVIDSGETILNVANKELAIRKKDSLKNLVTKYDELIQDRLIKQLGNVIVGAQFISEENPHYGSLDADDLFVIDSIDGTTNFIHSFGYSAISVAWYKSKTPIYGIVYNPYMHELYEAQTGKGAYLNSIAISVTREKLENSIVSFGTSPYNCETADMTFDMIKQIYHKCQDIRRMGSASLDICRVADGRVGLYFEAALSFWDYAAAGIILKEAGGNMVDFDGNSILPSLQKTSVIAGNINVIAESNLIRRNVI